MAFFLPDSVSRTTLPTTRHVAGLYSDSNLSSVAGLFRRSDREPEHGPNDKTAVRITALPPIPEGAYDTPSSVRSPHRDSKYEPDGRDHGRRSRGDPSTLTFRQRVHILASTIYGNEPLLCASSLDEQNESIETPKGWKLILILLSGALPYVVAIIDDTIIATIIPVLLTEFKAPQEIGWYASAYFLPLTIFMPLFGKAYSIWRIKWLFFSSLMVLLVGSVVCATARTSSTFIGGRVITGIGGAGIINGALRIIGVCSSRRTRTFLEASGALLMGVSTVSGPILGGVLSTHLGWRWAFWINCPVAGASLLVIALLLPAAATQAAFARLPLSKKIAKLDPLGSALLIAFLVCFIMLLEEVATSVTFKSESVVLAVFCGLLFVAFVVHEHHVRPDLALIPRDLIRHRALWSCCCTLFLLFAGWTNYVYFLSIFFQTVSGVDAQESAFNLLPYVVSVSIAAFITGVVVSYIRYYNPVFIVGGACFTTGAGLLLTIDELTSQRTRFVYEGLMGVGVGFIILGNVAPCQIFLDEKDHAVANGLTFFSSLLGATISLPISNVLFNRTLLRKIIALNVSDSSKIRILLDPTQVRAVTTPEQLPLAIDALVQSVRATFILGLVFSVLSACGVFLVPWKPLLLDRQPTVSRLPENSHLDS